MVIFNNLLFRERYLSTWDPFISHSLPKLFVFEIRLYVVFKSDYMLITDDYIQAELPCFFTWYYGSGYI